MSNAAVTATVTALADAQGVAKYAGQRFGLDEIGATIVAANPEADRKELLRIARAVAAAAGQGSMWTRILCDIVRELAPAPARRSIEQIAADRAAIVDFVRAGKTVRTQDWMRAVDITALVKQGVLDRDVRREYDAQGGNATNLFGGSAVSVRHRAYLSLHRA